MFHCRRMEVRTDLYSLNLLAKLFVLHCQILFSLAMAAIIEAILMRISAVIVTLQRRIFGIVVSLLA